MEECGRCKFKAHLIGLGLGVRCTHPDNQKYKREEDYQNMPLLISRVPNNCLLKETGQRKKLILHIPHSSTFLPSTFKVLDGVSLEHEFQRMTDWFTDELFDFEEAKKLVFPYSRLYCDVERFRQDKDELMARYGMGVCYTNTSYGTELRKISSKEKIFIKSSIYDEHHEKFESFVDEELRVQGSALIIDCHSFSNTPLPHEDCTERPDICIGTDSFHTPIELINYVCKYFENEGLTVSINEPFAGTIVPLKFYATDKRVNSIMIEINRKLYLDDDFKKNENFTRIKEIINDALKEITKAAFFNKIIF